MLSNSGGVSMYHIYLSLSKTNDPYKVKWKIIYSMKYNMRNDEQNKVQIKKNMHMMCTWYLLLFVCF